MNNSNTKEIITITPTKWVNGGFTLGHHEGKPVFITGGLPDIPQECIIEKSTSKVLYARVAKIQTDCAAYPECGGCSYRHIPYKEELQIKKEELVSSLNPSSHLEINIHSAKPVGYRNNVQWKVDGEKIGFHSRFSNRVVDLRTIGCLNLTEELRFPQSVDQLKLRLSQNKAIDYSKTKSEFRWETMTFQIPKDGFQQINRHLTQDWLQTIRFWLEPFAKQKLDCLELFSGMGLIGQVCSDLLNRIEGWELSSSAVEAAKKNALSNRIGQIFYKKVDLYQKLTFPMKKIYPLWIINPPRLGLGNTVTSMIQEQKPTHILYSSCDVQTLARDWKAIQKMELRYKIQKLALFDFFPRTKHFETLVLLSRN
jgi:23S rRNA (uracil1939-C5)-methyltransferase